MNYKKLTDDELITLSQKGDDGALETILVRYKPLVYKKAQAYYLAGGDDDDVIQEGLIGLYKAVMSFNKEKFPLFKFFAGVCVERRILSAVKKASRLKHNPLNTYVSLSVFNSDEENASDVDFLLDVGTDRNPEKILIEKENMSGLEGKIYEALSSFEMQVLMMVLDGYRHKEIAAALDRDSKAVDNAMHRIKKKLETVVNDRGEL